MHSPRDAEKPTCPYQIGFCVDICSHVPPPPFGRREYGGFTYRCPPNEFYDTMTHTDVVLAYPPVETPESAEPPITARLNIIEPLAVRDGRGAQLAVCAVTFKGSSQKLLKVVAKIYDPLYYPKDFDDYFGMPRLVTFYADRDYSNETSAYEHLSKAGQAGGFAPAYYGSWTFTLPIQRGHKTLQRPVRLILIERIVGPTIRDLCVAPGGPPFDDAYRLEIMARVLDGVVRQVHAGVTQGDLAGRNIILADLPPDSKKQGARPQTYPRPVLIDYNLALVVERTVQGKSKLQLNELPPNPMEYFWGSSFRYPFGSWIPRDWDDGNAIIKAQAWLRDRFGGKNASAYQHIPYELDDYVDPWASDSESG